MWANIFLPSSLLKKLIVLNLLICFMLSGLSSVFAAWDDYERGRTAFESGNNKAAFSAFRNVHYVQTIPYLEQIYQERKSRAKADLTEKDLSTEEFIDLEVQLRELKESPKYLGREDKDLQASLLHRQYLRDVQKSLKRKKQKTFNLPGCINQFVYGNYLYAAWIESKEGLTREVVNKYNHALMCGELSAFQRFQKMNERERALFSNRGTYEEELHHLRLGEEGVLERMYGLSNLYKERLHKHADAHAKERSQIWLRRAAKRGNILRAQQEILNFLEEDFSESFISSDVPIIEFPRFPVPKFLKTQFVENSELLSSQPPSVRTLNPLPLEEEQDSLKASMSLAAYAADNGDGLAALCIGQNYETGEIGGHPSHEKAFFWYNRSRQLGYTKAFIALGKIHETRGTSEEKSLARECYRQAAEQRCILGIFNAAIMALQASDMSEAQHWFEESTRMGYAASYVKLAELYTNNPGFENYRRAAQLLREFFASSHYMENLTFPNIRKSADKALAVVIRNDCYSKAEEEEIFKFAHFFRFREALLSLGEHYVSEINEISDALQKDSLRKKALDAFLIAAEEGNLYAKLMLAELMEHWNTNVKGDILKIRQFLTDLTTNEDPCMRIVGHFSFAYGYLKGNGILDKDREKSMLHYESILSLHERFPGTITNEGAYNCFLNLGYLHMGEEEASGSAPDYEKAFQLTQKACDFLSPKGTPYAEAYYNLSRFFLHGLGRPENLRETYRYLSIAAGEGKPVFPETGDPDAHHDLGLMYLEGSYISQDIDRAESLFENAVREGVTRACLSLGGMYVGRVPEKRNILKAIKVLEKGRHGGEMKCTLILAFINFIGEKGILEPNVEKAMEYIALARENGLTDEAIERSLQSFRRQSVVAGILQAPDLKSSAENGSQTKTNRLLEELNSTEITAATKWKSVEKFLATLIQLKGGNLKAGGGGSVRHFQVGDIQSSMHEIHKSGKGRGLGYGRAKSLKKLVQSAQED